MSYFVLTNDPDHGLLDDYRRIFRELGDRRILVTTAVFCVLKDDGSALARHCRQHETHCLADDAYRDFMLELRDHGHEIAFHGYSQASDTRDEFQRGLDIFRRTFGEYPRIYIEHGGHPRSHPPELCKRENLQVEGASPDSPHFVKDWCATCSTLFGRTTIFSTEFASLCRPRTSFASRTASATSGGGG